MVPEHSKRLIDSSENDLARIVENIVNRVFDARLPKAPTKYFSVTEASKILNISRPTIYKLISENRIDYRRANGVKRFRFTHEDIDKFLLKNPGFEDIHGEDRPKKKGTR